MELQIQQQGIEDSGKTNSLSSRQSSTRWTPTTDQIRILKDLYYNNGVRSPTAEQIQRISAKLRQYGKIEGKNVFYWFQNHKARERQKKRFSTDHHSIIMPMHNNSIIRPKNHHDLCLNIVYNGNNKLPSSMNYPAAASVSAGFVSVAMERSFREYNNSMGISNNAWIGTTTDHADNPYSSATQYPFLENARNVNNSIPVDHQTLESLEEDEEAPGAETLPLFPIIGDNLKKESRDYHYFNVWQRSDEEDSVSGARRANSLELTLNNSYSAAGYPND